MARCMLVIAVLVGSLGLVSGLQCYQCSSLLEPRCGSTWTFEGDEAQKYLVECPGNAKACDKILGDIQGNGKQHTYRLCWNQTIDYYVPPDECTDYYTRGGAYCHCTTPGCNGAEQKMAAMWWLIIAVVFSVVGWNL